MENISNQHIDAEECTKCPKCNKTSWYVMKCECGEYFCKNCSVKDERNIDSDTIYLTCPKCGEWTMYV